ncbi:AAA-associated domain-containing protein [Candidatus Liberibacter americanus]|uniref:ABC-type nitrate/sulfonate/bicarbonate transport system, ATPase component n=1 Tax=Candidatus Liberibacter americanus str. Sao Paulo TaxID=1261131 RepID=U6B6D9_9HYPH|nr:nitrate/sulfonate/bicarbonate ABC transporter ATP-binding protein [Candidatus Liberibacter americanus]AHA28344.1 ABC-type nitrate/sulfonate/bicarbonate transport system, ATPase component [Candidatus Liberibacter americanus str. Sao Paulo]EMS36634.1 ABC transporter nucleotide binding/ATPase protein [Candidatus Liberibacter americanus PW_SP]
MVNDFYNNNLLEVKDICQKFFFKRASGNLLVLDKVNFNIASGEIVGLLGRSGSGKSTLLRIIAGLVHPTSGEARFQNKIIKGPPKDISVVFQSFALFPWLTVLENVELGLAAIGIDKEERRKRALFAIDLIGLDGFESAYTSEISGGMLQRVGFARALVVYPSLLLMDEPFSALDVLTAENLRTDIIDLWIERKLPIKSILMVTHNIEEAVLMCDRVLIFSSNPGRIAEEVIVPMLHPRNRLSPEFRQIVDKIYYLMTKKEESNIGILGNSASIGVGMFLRHVSINLLSGLIEAIMAPPYDGKADLPELAGGRLQLETDELFHIGESLQLLRFVHLSEGDITLTEAGKNFANLGTDSRKRLFAKHLLKYVPLVNLIRRVLDERGSHSAPAARFRNELEDYMSEEYAKETINTVVSWGRYAELFSYDDQTELFSFDNPQ